MYRSLIELFIRRPVIMLAFYKMHGSDHVCGPGMSPKKKSMKGYGEEHDLNSHTPKSPNKSEPIKISPSLYMRKKDHIQSHDKITEIPLKLAKI